MANRICERPFFNLVKFGAKLVISNANHVKNSANLVKVHPMKTSSRLPTSHSP